MEKKELVYIGNGSEKFWNIELEGCAHTVHYGRIGTEGQRKTKEFATSEKAAASFQKLIASKTKKGYSEVGSAEKEEADGSKLWTREQGKSDLADGETAQMQGSAAKPYLLRNTGGVYSCSCPAWRNQSKPIEQRTCKHLRLLRGDAAEEQRVGELSQAPRKVTEGPGVLLAQTWDGELDLSDWWLSEKLDGVRAYWDGENLMSRLGNAFLPPDWFLSALPSEPLDGELFVGRKQFQRTVSIVRRQDRSEHWKEVQFVLFDAPAHPGGFEQRIERCRQLVKEAEAPFLEVLEQQVCRSMDHMLEELARIEELGGEGVMARKPGSLYQSGRSFTLLKIKTFLDAEAVVIGHQPGTGRHQGRLGSLKVELPSGVQFSVGTGFSDSERENPPAVGSTITFRYQELSRDGVPRFPSFVRQRAEL